jgi:uncharacterized membrane protein
VILGGEKGKALEDKYSTSTAAYLIYRKSSDLPFALNFYDTNEGAMKEIERMAQVEIDECGMESLYDGWVDLEESSGGAGEK